MDSLLEQLPRTKHSAEEERALAARIRRGDENAQVELVMSNMREALIYTQRVCGSRIDPGIRLSLCYQKMMMSARRFVPGRLRFFAFAKAGLRGCMSDYWKKLPVVRNAKEVWSLDLLDEHCRKGVFNCMRLSPQGLLKPVKPLELEPSSLVKNTREIVTGEIDNTQLDRIMATDRLKTLLPIIRKCLSEQQWIILMLVYRAGMNFPEVGKLLELTRSAVHASHKKSLEKIRAALRSIR